MLSLAQAADRRGASGAPLPAVYQSLADRQAYIRRSQLTLLVGPPSAGKSLLAWNLLVAMRLYSLALLPDSDPLETTSRFAAAITGKQTFEVEQNIDEYRDILIRDASHIQVAFDVPEYEDIKLQMSAYEQRYGEPPAVLLVDNLGNLTSGYDNEWAALKALTLDLGALATKEQCAVIACAHTTDLENCEPGQRTKILGKIVQYARLILSVGFNPATGAYKIAIVKNRNGKSDISAQDPITFHADPARMLLTESVPPPPHPQLVQARQQAVQVQRPAPAYSGWRGGNG